MSNPDSIPHTGPFTSQATELRRLADLLDTVTEAHGLPVQTIRVSLPTVHFGRDAAAEVAEVARVDTLANVFGLEQPVRRAHGAVTHYESEAERDGVRLWVYGYVPGESEVERLRAQLAERDAELASLRRKATAEAILTPDAGGVS